MLNPKVVIRISSLPLAEQGSDGMNFLVIGRSETALLTRLYEVGGNSGGYNFFGGRVTSDAYNLFDF